MKASYHLGNFPNIFVVVVVIVLLTFASGRENIPTIFIYGALLGGWLSPARPL